MNPPRKTLLEAFELEVFLYFMFMASVIASPFHFLVTIFGSYFKDVCGTDHIFDHMGNKPRVTPLS